MRIVVVAPNIPLPGTHGGSTHVTELTAALRRRHDVVVLARRESHGEGVVGIGGKTARGPLRYARALSQLPAALGPVRAFSPDVIYERFSAYGLGIALGRIVGAPVVSMVLDESATWLTLAGADRLITTAPHLVPARFRSKLVRVHWGANVETFHPGVAGAARRRQHGISAEEIVISYTGAFYPWHGLEELVDAAALLRARSGRKLRFLLVGDGATRAAIEARIDRTGVRASFVTTGRVPYEDVPSYLAASDICVAAYVPARHPELARKGMFFDPLKVFEYMAMARPVVVLDAPNIRDLFEDRRHAWLVPPADVDALARALDGLAASPDLRREMGTRARALVEARYSWQAHGDHLETIFTDLLERRQQHARLH